MRLFLSVSLFLARSYHSNLTLNLSKFNGSNAVSGDSPISLSLN